MPFLNLVMTDTQQQYQRFLQSKRHSVQDFGITPNCLPDTLFDFQKYVAEYAIKKGRCAVFLDTGLGKSLLELIISANYAKHTNKPVLLLTPLSVAPQFLREAEKFGIDDVEYSKDGKFTKKIIVTNYQRLHYFNAKDFDCVCADESGCLKDEKSATRDAVISFMRKIKYRFLFTATPSPNDFIELGNSSEALGYMGFTDMLGKFFRNNEDTISPMNIGTEWVLKAHAKEAFFQWVSGWSISCRKPSDLGFSDAMHVLPELITSYHEEGGGIFQLPSGQRTLFAVSARSQSEIRIEQKATIQKRCEKAVQLARPHDISVYWCNFNAEGDLLAKLDKSAYQLSGSMKDDAKEELLDAFFMGKVDKLITKSSMTGWGLNWQRCNHTVFFPTFSYESYYQSIRRFWRFGQKKPVECDIIYSEGQKRVLESLLAKATKANELFDKLNYNLNKRYDISETKFNQQIELPEWL